MLTTVQPNAQIVGRTIFSPPTEEDEQGISRLIFTPDDNNLYDTFPDGEAVYDGEALVEFAGRACYQSFHKPNPKTASNEGYLAHILETGHGSVLEHASVSIYITGVSRSFTHELIRHRHFSFSELSQRFVNMAEANKVIPPLFEQMAEDYWNPSRALGAGEDAEMEKFFAPFSVSDALSTKAYEELVERGIAYLKDVHSITGFAARKKANEMARAIMPSMVETRIVVTGNYRAWMGFLTKREDPAADAEIRRVAEMIADLLEDEAPSIFGSVRDQWREHGTLL